jgi:hypothetical protein
MYQETSEIICYYEQLNKVLITHLARLNHTFVDVDFAIRSLEAGAVAQTDERVDAVDASSVV